MIITKTPYRISFFGGGTDFPLWFKEHSGATISTTIGKYSYLLLRELPNTYNYIHRIRYSQIEEVSNPKNIKHKAIKKTLEYFKINKKLDLSHFGEMPARTGVASSSAFTVGLIQSLHELIKKPLSKKVLAIKSIKIEREVLLENSGYQDPLIIANGGFNHIKYNNKIKIESLQNNKSIINELERWCLLVFLGQGRISSNIQKIYEKKFSKKKISILKEMNNTTDFALKIFKNNNKKDITDVCKLMKIQWELKKLMNPLSTNNFINDIYQNGLKSGAVSGKILGAGGTGFFLFLVPPSKHKIFKRKIKFPVNEVYFENIGSEVIQKI